MNYPKSTALKILEGNLGKRPLNEDEPQPPIEMPEIPVHLDERAAEYWNKYSQMLFDMGIFTLQDGPAFGEVCQMYAEIQTLTEEIRTVGRVFIKVSVDGAGIEHQEFKTMPQVKQLQELRKEFRYTWGQFGGNPSDRTRISGKSPTPNKKQGIKKYLT